jgi:V8-like Glu-specific endopeptidase
MISRKSTIALTLLLLCSGSGLAAQDLEDKKFFAERRAAFERTGEAPTVPRSLSADPADSEYVFLGYMPIADAKQRMDHFARLKTEKPRKPSAAEARSRSLRDQEIAAVFVNEAGEKWGYKPRNLDERLAGLRSASGSSRLRGAEGNPGVGVEGAGELMEVPSEGIKQITGKDVLGGVDNRILRSAVTGFDMTAYPWRALGVLVPDASNLANIPPVSCTATKIGERILLTAAHCVFAQGGGVASLMPSDWWPGGDGLDKTMTGGDPSPNHYKNVIWYAFDPKFVDDGWATRDFAILVLHDNQSSCDLGWFGYRVDNSLAASEMWNFGYPGENQNCTASPRGDDNCGGSLYGMSETVTRTDASHLYYQHDTTGGHSGSPIYDFNGGNRQVVGVHQGPFTGVENRGVKIRNLVYDFIDAVRSGYPSAYCNP